MSLLLDYLRGIARKHAMDMENIKLLFPTVPKHFRFIVPYPILLLTDTADVGSDPAFGSSTRCVMTNFYCASTTLAPQNGDFRQCSSLSKMASQSPVGTM